MLACCDVDATSHSIVKRYAIAAASRARDGRLRDGYVLAAQSGRQDGLRLTIDDVFDCGTLR